MKLRYGFVGLGNLGKHLAANLARGGFGVGVYDLERSAADAVLAVGAHWADSIPELAKSCDALITCLPSPAATKAVFDLALPSLHRGNTWIEMSTNDFAEVEFLATRAREHGIATLACPVTGGVHRAEAGDITVLVGGAQQVYAVHQSALEAMGGRVIYLGGIDSCCTIDLTRKDAGFALDVGRRFGVPLRLAGVMEQTFIEGRAKYGGAASSSMIVKLLEDSVGTPLRAPGFPDKLGADGA